MAKYKHKGSVHLFEKEPKTTIGDFLLGLFVVFIFIAFIVAVVS